MAASDNVTNLLDALCRSLYRDFSNRDGDMTADGIDTKFVRRCKTVAYEVLLKKAPAKLCDLEPDQSDPSKHLRYCQFECNLQMGLAKSLEFGNYGMFNANTGFSRRIREQNVLVEKTLAILNNSDGEDMTQQPIMLVLTNLINLACNRGGQQQRSERFAFQSKKSNAAASRIRSAAPKIDFEIHQLPKLDSFLNERPRFKSVQARSASQLSIHTSFSQPLLPRDHGHSYMRTLSMPSGPVRADSVTSAALPSTSSNMFYTANNWECLGDTINLDRFTEADVEQRRRRFTSDATSCLLPLDAVHSKSQHLLISCRVIDQNLLMSHVKAMTVGVESDTFRFAANEGVFRMMADITVDGVQKSTMRRVLDEFIECGSCYKRMKMLISRDRESIMDGHEHSYMFAVMCNAFDKYLETFRRTVVFVEDKSVLQMGQRLAPLIAQIRNLAKVLSIHPDDTSKGIPVGSKFLGYLHRLSTTVTQKDVSLLLVYILTECCDIYYKNFEIWLYRGIINNACSDLFIGYIDTYRPCTVFHFEHAHFIRSKSIPGFLDGLQDLVLLCGKYVDLLKTHKPLHPLFELAPPSISVCLSFDDMDNLEKSCREYVARAQQICGPPVVAREVFQNSMPNVNKLSQLSRDRLEDHIRQWKVDRADRIAVERVAADKERESLQMQIDEKRQRIIDERRQEINLEQRNEQIQNEMELERLTRENAERMARLSHIAELEQIADRQLDRANDRIADLSEQIERGSVGIVGDDPSPNGNSAPITILDNCESATIEAQRNRYHNTASSILFGDLCVKTDELSARKTRSNTAMMDDNLNRIEAVVAQTATSTIHANAANAVAVKLPDACETNSSADKDDNSNFDRSSALPTTTPSSSTRRRLCASFSLDLKAINDEQMQPTPMSTTSDHLLDSFDPDGSRTSKSKSSHASEDSDEFLSANGSPMQLEQVDRTNNNGEISLELSGDASVEPPSTPILAMKPRVNHFLIKSLATPIPPLPHDSSTPNTSTRMRRNSLLPHDQFIQSNKYSIADLCNLNVTNLTNFLQKSFSIPLHAHFGIVNNELLKVFLCDLNIFSHFNSLRNYFLMMDSEFANNIFSGLMEKLESAKNPNELINSSVLHSVLGNALHSNMATIDGNVENVSFALTNVPAEWNLESPDVFNPILLTYHVNWPLNLVIGSETIDHYGYIFQYLLKMKRVAYVLEQTFFKLKDTRKQSADQILKSAEFIHIQHIRHRLLCFINGLQSYVNTVVLQSSWLIFCDELQQVKSLEDICRSHAKYLNRIGFLCMLTNKSQTFLSKLNDIFCLIIRFSSLLHMRNWRCDEQFNYSHPKYAKILQIERDFHTLIRFIIHAAKKMCRKGFQKEIGEFISLINMNEWY